MGLLKIFKNRKINKAIKKTQNLMSNYNKTAIVSLSGKKSSYEEYFIWLNTVHPEWIYRVDNINGMIFVYIEENK